MTRTAIRNITDLALAALAALVACGCAHPSTRTSAMPTPAARITDQNKQSVQRLFETFNYGDLGIIDELVGPEYQGAQGDRGPAGFRAVVVGLRTAFPDLHYTLEDVMAEGDKVAVRWHWTGTHKAAFRVFPATGKVVTNTGVGIFQLADGKVVAAVLETDRLGFLEQIGAVPEGVGRGPQPPPLVHP